VQVAVVYRWGATAIYRNGRKYAEYRTDNRLAFGRQSILFLGAGSLADNFSMSALFAGELEEVRLYNVALAPETIACLRLNEPSEIEAIGQWTFKDGTTRDSTGHFPPGILQGTARLSNGRLLLDGHGFLVVPPIEEERNAELVFSDTSTQKAMSWRGAKWSKTEKTIVPAPEMLSWIADDAPNGLSKILRVDISRDAQFGYFPNTCGALCYFDKPAAPGRVLRIGFLAKSLGGASWLTVYRLGDGSPPVKARLGTQWQHFELEMPLGWTLPVPTGGLAFSVTESRNPADMISDGAFLLEHVRVESVSDRHRRQ
jgi:hypothetical protein